MADRGRDKPDKTGERLVQIVAEGDLVFSPHCNDKICSLNQFSGELSLGVCGRIGSLLA